MSHETHQDSQREKLPDKKPWDKTFAHKPWIVKHDGVVYHFYNAVGDQGRVIGLATSKDLKNPAK
jgi:hypothetical protein